MLGQFQLPGSWCLECLSCTNNFVVAYSWSKMQILWDQSVLDKHVRLLQNTSRMISHLNFRQPDFSVVPCLASALQNSRTDQCFTGKIELSTATPTAWHLSRSYCGWPGLLFFLHGKYNPGLVINSKVYCPKQRHLKSLYGMSLGSSLLWLNTNHPGGFFSPFSASLLAKPSAVVSVGEPDWCFKLKRMPTVGYGE